MKILRWIGIGLLNIYALLMVALPITGLVFLASCVFAGGAIGLHALGANFGPVPAWSLTWLKLAWKIELLVAIPILWIFVTMRFQHCCVGMQRFRDHLCHTSVRGHLEDVLASLLWPYTVYITDQNMLGWMMSWFIISLNVADYWLISRWKGTRMDVFNGQSGEVETHFIQPDDSLETIMEALSQMQWDED